jgi:ribosomal protein L6P/L9E
VVVVGVTQGTREILVVSGIQYRINVVYLVVVEVIIYCL